MRCSLRRSQLSRFRRWECPSTSSPTSELRQDFSTPSILRSKRPTPDESDCRTSPCQYPLARLMRQSGLWNPSPPKMSIISEMLRHVVGLVNRIVFLAAVLTFAYLSDFGT